MARYRAIVELPLALEDAFAYMSDFANAAEWDPGIVAAHRIGDGPIAAGSRFHLESRFLGRTTPIVYEIESCDPPHRVVFAGENGAVTSRDVLTFERSGEGTRLDYDAELFLKGPAARLADPVLALVFRRVGDRALEGLRRAVGPSAGDAL
jgi:carbon monoxide dehydrogenase subunit G